MKIHYNNILCQCKKAAASFNGHLSQVLVYNSLPNIPFHLFYFTYVDLSHYPFTSALLATTWRRVQMICHCSVRQRKGRDLMAVYCSGSKQRALVACA